MQQTLTRSTLHGRYALRPRLGDAAQTVQQAGAIATPVVTGVLASSAASAAAAAGTSATILGLGLSAAIPIIGAAIAGITLGITALLRSGCGQTCIVTSNWANQAEDLLSQNIRTYFSIPAPRTTLQQQAALENFDKVWAYLYQECSATSLGTAGQNCINDRKAGACKWKQTTDSPLLAYPGEPQPGECWNWFSGYRDPIANDPNVVAPTLEQTLTSADTGVASVLQSAGSAIAQANPLLLIGAVALIGFALVGKKGN